MLIPQHAFVSEFHTGQNVRIRCFSATSCALGAQTRRRQVKALRYVGKVGTGFTMKVSADLRRRLDALPSPKQKLVARKHIKAVEPKLVARVEYRDITADGYLRHPSFKGLAED
ncbi:ATP-dependent DNA ligase [Bradyrhizobium diazoefficiens]